MTDERHATPPAETPAQSAVGAPAAGPPSTMPGQTPAPEVRPGAPPGRRRRDTGRTVRHDARAAGRRRRGTRLEGRTATSYPLRDEDRRTVGYLRLIVGQAHIPDAATVAVDVDRITIEWDD